MQYNLRTMLLVITTLSAVFAMAFADNKFIQLVAISVIVANGLGAIAALVLTHGLKMPRDGSYWREDDEADELNSANESNHHSDSV